MIKNPGRLAHNAIGPRLRVRPGRRVQHHRPDPGQPQFAGQHQPIRTSACNNDLSHLARPVAVVTVTSVCIDSGELAAM